MASLKLSISLDTYDSRKKIQSWPLSDHPHLMFAFTSHTHINCVYTTTPFNKSKEIKASRLNSEIVTSIPECIHVGKPTEFNRENSVPENPNFDGRLRKGRRSIWKRFQGLKKMNKDANLISMSKGSVKKDEVMQEPMLASDEGENDNLLDADPDMNLERCNFMLEQFARDRDGQALRFFEWMRSNRKLKGNVPAYILILRVLGRRQDWDRAETMIEEMATDSGCGLSFQVFNTLIYACHKQGLVKLGAKWFRMMLDKGVQPNVATFGMLMSLYQKGRVVEEAEFAFSQMRKLKIICQYAYSAMITIYTRLGLYDEAEVVIGFLREDRVILNKDNWLVLLNAYSQQGKLDSAEKVLKSMQKAGYAPHIVAYNTLITGYGKLSNMEAAKQLFQNLAHIGLEPDETTYRSMIEGWGRVNNYVEADWCYKELKRAGFKPNSSNLLTIINLQAKHGDEEGSVRTVSDMLMMGCQYSSVLSIVLQAYENAERFSEFPSVVKGLFYDHVLNNQTSCSILVVAYVKHGLVDNTIDVLQNKRWEDPEFEDSLYHLLICSCKELGFLENAIKIYTSMPESNKPNLHIACTMIDIYSGLSLFNEAETLYLKLKSSGIALDLIAFSIVVRMYVKSGSLKAACSVLDVMDKQKNIIPDVYLIRDMLRIYQQLGMVDKLADVYYKILKTGVSWDQEMYNCVINCCARALPIDELSRLFHEMLERGFSPNTITYNVMLDVYGKSRLLKKAKKVLWMAEKRGLVDVVSYNTIVAACGRNKELRSMASYVKKMQSNGFPVSLEAYNCMLDAYGKEGQMDKLKSVLQKMKESSCASDRYTYNILMNIYGEKGCIDEVADVLVKLKECGMGLDLCGYNTLIKAYGNARMVEEAVSIIQGMIEKGIEPDHITYQNLISALQRNDQVLEALRWSLWIKQMNI